LIDGAALSLHGELRVVAQKGIDGRGSPAAPRRHVLEGAMHA
jgi:hypothetical protein